MIGFLRDAAELLLLGLVLFVFIDVLSVYLCELGQRVVDLYERKCK